MLGISELLSRNRCDASRLTKRDQPPASFVPQNQLHALQTLPQRDPADLAEFRMVMKDLGQAIVRDLAREMVHMVDADIAGQPAQRTWEIIV